MRSQKGAALLLFFLVVFVFGISVWLAAANRSPPIDSGAPYRRVLDEARAQLLVHAVANAARPGWLPYPDRRSDGDYDGNGDCVNSFASSNDAQIVGEWPFEKEQGCVLPVTGSPEALAAEIRDPDGNRLWVAVSRNLVWNRPDVDGGRWLTVRTPGGVVNRVAVVIISPGLPLNGQDRSGTTPAIGEFLEGTTVDGIAVSNADGDVEFVSAPATAQFNDRLAYIGAGELMTRVTRRVAGEIKAALDGMGSYPPALPAAITAWYDPFWSPVTTYSRLSATTATLTFQGCAGVTYQLDSTAPPVGVTPAGARC